MTLDAAATLGEAGAAFRRERTLVLPIAAMLLFLPVWALVLLVPRPPAPPPGATPGSAAAMAWADTVATWAAAHGGGWLIAAAVVAWGLATLHALFLDSKRPPVGRALRRGAAMLPRAVLAGALVALPVLIGLRLWLLPGAWLLGRLLLVGPVLAAEPRTGATAAIARSLRLTRGAGLPLAALVAAGLAVLTLAEAPLVALDRWLRALDGGENPVALMIVDAVAAAGVMAALLAWALLAIAAYRRLAR